MSARFQIKYCTSLGMVENNDYWVKPVPLDRVACLNITNTEIFSLAGGKIKFKEVDICSYKHSSKSVSVWRGCVSNWLRQTKNRQAAEDKLHQLVLSRPKFAGLNMSDMHLMGVVNVTPDSFSDGGQFLDPEKAIKHAELLVREGASIIDVGGESTRPGASKINPLEEQKRVIPVIRELSKKDKLISVDTRNPEVMRKALSNGAKIINDISGFRNNESIQVIIEAFKNKVNPYIVIMHMQGEPSTMQVSPSYNFTPIDIYTYLEERINFLIFRGIPKQYIAIDVGFGFGKTVSDNLSLIDWMPLFHGLGVPIIVGVSRKSTIAKIDDNAPVDKRIGGSIALTLKSIDAGVQIVRSHDIQETRQAIKLWQAY